MEKKYANLFCVSAILAGTALADATYEAADGVLSVTVGAGETNAMDSAYVGQLNANAFSKLVKKGAGGLDVAVSLEGFMGAIDVDEGTYIYRTSTSLGSLAEGNGAVTVKDGATLCAWCETVNGLYPYEKTFVIAGDGVNGAGALDCRTEQQNGPFGGRIILAGNARIRNKTQWYPSNDKTKLVQLDMVGHDLKIYSEGSTPSLRYMDILNPGNIVFENNKMTIADTVGFGGSAENKLIIENGGSLHFATTAKGKGCWTVQGSPNGYGAMYGDGTYSQYNTHPGASTNAGDWAGAVELKDDRQRVMYGGKRNGGLSLGGKVTGEGGFQVYGNAEWDGNGFKHPYLNLINSENDFTKGVECYYGGLRVWNDGALPDASPLVLNRDGEVVFENLVVPFSSLPQLKVTGDRDAKHPEYVLTNVVRFGRGKWKGIEKTGGEPLAYYSGIGADVFDIRKGTVLMSGQSKIAGLIGGCRKYASYEAAKAAYDSGEIVTNGFYAGVNALYDIAHEWWTVSGGCNLITYHGYIWNRTGGDVTWSFAGGRGSNTKFSIDGEVLFDRSVTNGPVVCTVTLSHGCHEFDLRIVKNNQSYYWNNFTEWRWESFEFGYDPHGRGSDIEAYYKKISDPGDGSFLTVCRPEDDLVYPGYEEEGIQSHQVDFGTVKFAEGTSIDFQGTPYVFNNIEGIPAISNCPHFAVTGTWSVATADLGVKVLETAGSADFSKAKFATLEAPPKDVATYAICVAEKGITGVPAYDRPSPASRPVKFAISADGKTLYASFAEKGLVIGIR